MAEAIGRQHLDLHVDSRLRTRIRMYIGIAVVLVLAVGYRTWEEGLTWYTPLTFVVGILAGFLFSRMFKIHWDIEGRKVMSRLDSFGGVVLACYVAFEIAGHLFFDQYFSGPSALTLILALAAGAVLGRGLGMARTMVQVLRENI